MKLREKRLGARKDMNATDEEVFSQLWIILRQYWPGCHFTEYMDPYPPQQKPPPKLMKDFKDQIESRRVIVQKNLLNVTGFKCTSIYHYSLINTILCKGGLYK